METRIGQHIGQYRLTHRLGAGRIAEVYLGEHLLTQTQAAIKLFTVEIPDAKKNMFQAEAQRIAELKHPHILPILDSGLDGSTPFQVITYAAQGTLRDRHPAGLPVSLPQVLSYVTQLASALQSAHTLGLIHHNIKPENILLDEHGTLQLSDFSITTIARASTNIASFTFSGTPGYMSPEQYRLKPVLASDQYVLAVCIYEWLTGGRPYASNRNFSYMQEQHSSAPIPSLRIFDPSLPSELEHVIQTALAKAPEQRFASIQAFAQAFEQAAQVAPVTLASTTQTHHLSFPTSAIPPRLTYEGHTNGASFLALSPDGRQLASSLANQRICLWDVATSSLLTSFDTPWEVEELDGFSWSPDGRLLAGYQSKCLCLWDVTTGSLLASLNTPGRDGTLIGHHWSPDGHMRAGFQHGEGAFTIWDAYTGEQLYTCQIPNWQTYLRKNVYDASIHDYLSDPAEIEGLAWSPDGHWIAVFAKIVAIVDARTGKHLLTYKHEYKKFTDIDADFAARVERVCWSPDGQYLASSGSGTIDVWNPHSGQRYAHFEQKAETEVHWAPIGTTLAILDGKTIEIRNINSDDLPIEQEPVVYNMQNYIWTFAWSPDGRFIATSTENTTHVWDAQSARTLQVLQDPGSSVRQADYIRALRWSPDGGWLLLASWSMLQCWSTTGQFLTTYQDKRVARVHHVAWSPDGHVLASVGWNEDIHIWDARTGKRLTTHRLPRERDRGWGDYFIAWSPDSRFLATCTSEAIMIWEIASDVLTFLPRKRAGSDRRFHTYEASACFAWSPDGRYLSARLGFSNSNICIFEVSTGNSFDIKHPGQGYITSLAWSPDSRYLALRVDDRHIEIWEVETRVCLHSYKGLATIRLVAWSTDGQYLVTNNLTVLDAKTGTVVRLHSGEASAILCSPDSKYLLIAARKGEWTVLEAQSGQHIHTFTPPAHEKLAVAWTPNGIRVASYGYGVHIWPETTDE